jgi:hypothetical protein
LNLDNLEGKALLLDHSMELGVVTIDSVLQNSGGPCGLVGKVQRNRERQRDDGGASGLSGGALAGFIGQEEGRLNNVEPDSVQCTS